MGITDIFYIQITPPHTPVEYFWKKITLFRKR